MPLFSLNIGADYRHGSSALGVANKPIYFYAKFRNGDFLTNSADFTLKLWLKTLQISSSFFELFQR
jgi:hypothetical protein